jgi:hypothetical protein
MIVSLRPLAETLPTPLVGVKALQHRPGMGLFLPYINKNDK